MALNETDAFNPLERARQWMAACLSIHQLGLVNGLTDSCQWIEENATMDLPTLVNGLNRPHPSAAESAATGPYGSSTSPFRFMFRPNFSPDFSPDRSPDCSPSEAECFPIQQPRIKSEEIIDIKRLRTLSNTLPKCRKAQYQSKKRTAVRQFGPFSFGSLDGDDHISSL